MGSINSSGESAAAPSGASIEPGLPAAAIGRTFGGTPDKPAKPAPLEGVTARDLGEVIRFDGSPEWVMARWPRVTAGLANLDLQGYRVPLVSGTAQDDLAGSLTYYFDRNQQVAAHRLSRHDRRSARNWWRWSRRSTASPRSHPATPACRSIRCAGTVNR